MLKSKRYYSYAFSRGSWYKFHFLKKKMTYYLHF